MVMGVNEAEMKLELERQHSAWAGHDVSSDLAITVVWERPPHYFEPLHLCSTVPGAWRSTCRSGQGKA